MNYLTIGWNAPARHVAAKPVIGDCKWSKALKYISGLRGKGFCVALVGNRGAGKTQIGVQMMKLYVHFDNKPAHYLTTTEFFLDVKHSYRADSHQSERELIDDLRKPKLLVLDELGKRGDTQWENNLLFELLNKRYADMTDTLLICNLSRDEFEKSVGDSIVSRINETGGIINCDWESFRK